MRYLALFLLPPLLVFGLYNLSVWFNILGVARHPFWKRVALVSTASHVLFALGVAVLLYVDFRSTAGMFGGSDSFGAFLMNSTDLWQAVLVFDTVAAVSILGLMAVFSSSGAAIAAPLVLTTVLVVGSVQWYLVGAFVGWLLDRLWSGLKTQDEDGPDWL